MDFFLEMFLTAILSLFFSFLVSKLVSLAMAGNRENDENLDMNVETGDRYGIEADRVNELEEAATGNGNICDELVFRIAEAESTAAVSSAREIGAELESEEVRVESSNAVEEENEYKREWNSEEEKEELVIEEEEDDGWEGIERSELEKAFVAAATFLEESGKAEEIGAEAKMELYGLHKIATEGSCRESQPMALMLSARARWNAWQKLGNMNQEEAMEKYLALVSKEIPSCNVSCYT